MYESLPRGSLSRVRGSLSRQGVSVQAGCLCPGRSVSVYFFVLLGTSLFNAWELLEGKFDGKQMSKRLGYRFPGASAKMVTLYLLLPVNGPSCTCCQSRKGRSLRQSISTRLVLTFQAVCAFTENICLLDTRMTRVHTVFVSSPNHLSSNSENFI